MKLASLAIAAVLVVAGSVAAAAANYFAYNLTAATSFSGVYLAPAGAGQSGTDQWGPNQALNDDDKSLDFGERLTLTGLTPGIYDVKLIDDAGRTCILHGVDLKTQTSFEIRDAGLTDCK
jgi:hypothetical protein